MAQIASALSRHGAVVDFGRREVHATTPWRHDRDGDDKADASWKGDDEADTRWHGNDKVGTSWEGDGTVDTS